MKKSLCAALALILIFTCLFTACGKKGDSSSKQSANSSSTTQAAETKPADPLALTKADFSYGGNTVKSYHNFIDLCEAQSGVHHYYFTVESDACQKANRGININDDANHYFNKIKDKYGTPISIEEQCEAPHVGSLGDKYTYSFQYNGRRYSKIFYTQYQHGGGEDYVTEIVYKVD